MTNTYFPMLVINYFMFIKFMAYNVKKHYGSGSSCDISNLDNRYINNIILIFQNVAYISSHAHIHKEGSKDFLGQSQSFEINKDPNRKTVISYCGMISKSNNLVDFDTQW